MFMFAHSPEAFLKSQSDAVDFSDASVLAAISNRASADAGSLMKARDSMASSRCLGVSFLLSARCLSAGMAAGFQSLQVSLANSSDHSSGFWEGWLSLMAVQMACSLLAAPRPMDSV